MKRPDTTWATNAGKRHAPRNIPLTRIAPVRELVDDAHKVLATRRAYPGKKITHKRILLVLEESDLNHTDVRARLAELAEHGRSSEILIDITTPAN